MKAAIIHGAGAAPRYGDFADPEPADGESEVRMLAAGIHPVVRSLAAGAHYGSEGAYPLVPGVDGVAMDAAGTARYVGWIRVPWGTLAERAASRMGLPVPDGADPIVVAGAMNPGLSSWLPLVARTREVPALGTVLIVGATGVAGRIAVQNARALGADRVIGLGRDRARLAEVAALGATPVALDEGADAVARSLDGVAPTLILDYVWGAAAETVWDALAVRGLGDDDADIVHVQIGTSGRARAALPGALLRSRNLVVRGAGAGSTPVAEIMAQLPAFMARIAAGEVTAPVRAFGLSQVADAWAYTGPDRAVVVPD
ncbi:zinc-binding alcohol dehydrogenase family protein [Microbacterium protaetiae]|uniref:Zinc-binding alcohol dehydrogenase family protein n=1 Tax=Microbacterium protaetiae TaxID=2509458 RepID=A0A4P6EIG4_9MICO|nr:zinc-binding alcohol dehydrogenase family protein [Microbacterium protaetiae]QAY59957.1 zinc-binding alcohol dehydrogenase family protein [Microbacterium protaetiae]